jgi:hypothetical protein
VEDAFVRTPTAPAFVAAERQPDRRAGGDRSDHAGRSRHEGEQHHGEHGDRRTLPVGAQLPRHAPHRLGDDGDGDDLQPLQRAGAERPGHLRSRQREAEQDQRRRQGEGDEGGERTGPPRPHHAKREPDLAGGRPRQELAQRHQIGIGAVVEPAPPHHQFLAEITQMRDWPAEGGQAEPEEDREHLGSAAALYPGTGAGGLFGHLAVADRFRVDAL